VDELDEVRLIIEELHGGLDTLPYHVFLGVREDCDGDALRAAFHQRAQKFHPDRFHSLGDQELRARVYEVYKRITEAYRVLGNPEDRRRYDEQRRGGGGVRLPPQRAVTEESIPAAARRFYKAALEAEQQGDQKSARLNLELARQMAPGNPLIEQKLKGG
jgi:curved DNA-binding protein CbpA